MGCVNIKFEKIQPRFFLQKKLHFISAGNENKIPHCVSHCKKKMECHQTQNTVYAAEKNMIAYLTVD